MSWSWVAWTGKHWPLDQFGFVNGRKHLAIKAKARNVQEPLVIAATEQYTLVAFGLGYAVKTRTWGHNKNTSFTHARFRLCVPVVRKHTCGTCDVFLETKPCFTFHEKQIQNETLLDTCAFTTYLWPCLFYIYPYLHIQDGTFRVVFLSHMLFLLSFACLMFVKMGVFINGWVAHKMVAAMEHPNRSMDDD